MRPKQFDSKMSLLGWSLVRVSANGHHMYTDGYGKSLTVEVDDAGKLDRYLARYLRRDARRKEKGQHG